MLKDIIKIDHDLRENRAFMKRRKAMKIFIFITRIIIFSLIIILFAKPYLEMQTTERGSPEVTILIDNSTSMSVFDLDFVNSLTEEIKKHMPVTIRTITSNPLNSNLGEEIISHIERNSNILLISDMQDTGNIPLEDALLYSSLLNATISGIELKSNKKDLSVWIEGESKITLKQETSFNVHINKLNMNEYNLIVTINDVPVYNARTNRDKITITHSFDIGDHLIKAQILDEDDIPENNVFYKTISVLPQPKILYVTRDRSKLQEVLAQHYDIVQTNTIPNDLSPYYAVIIENMNVNQITNIKILSDYISEGNGLMVIGGMNSYDRGGYKSSLFETLLPVSVGRGDKRQGDSNIVLLIDMSGSTQEYWIKDESGRLIEVKDASPLDQIKRLSIDVIQTLNRGNKVGVIGFAIPDPNKAKAIPFGAVRIANMELLGNIRESVIDKISRISVQGQKLYDVGFTGAYSMIKHETGSRNVILITDGGSHLHKPVKDNAINIVSRMASEGIRTYTVGIVDEGRGLDEDFLRKVAQVGNGNYFPARNIDNLKILFGTPEEKNQGDEMVLFIINPTHFIARELDLDAKVYGFNQVVPKNLARLIVTTDSGEPVLTEWRFGLGRVVALTAFSGESGLGQILQGNNSRLITRSVNYIIGNPERKRENIVTIPDTRINELVDIHIISKEYPRTDLDLIKIKDNEYIAKTLPEKLGENTLLYKTFAVNYPKEYQRLGMNPEAKTLLGLTNGELFTDQQKDEIIDHIKISARRIRIEKSFVTWPILIIIIIVYLFEIGCRKIIENKRKI
jgi:heat shock protein HspQ